MQLLVNGLKIEANYTDECIQNIFYPLLEKWTNIQKEKNRRIIIYLAAPPGCGKSTLALYLEYLSKTKENLTPLQALGMDGFHHTNIYLNSHLRETTNELLALHKGAPDTFNVESLTKHIKSLQKDTVTYWPVYDRQLHDPIENAIEVTSNIILIEGNYLLLDKAPWNSLKNYADYTIFISGEPIDLENRLIQRKMHSGTSFETALKHYHDTDKPNLLLVNKYHLDADLSLKLCVNKDNIVSFY